MMNRNVLLALTLVVGSWLLGAACGSSTSPSPAPKAADVTVSIVANAGANSFSPNPVTVTAGQTISWKNNDSIVHQITQDANQFSTANVSNGAATSAITLTTKGTITYHCGIHPTMTGTITVQ